MLRSLKQLDGFSVQASDNHDIGKIKDIYFDDEKWTTRYLVLETGGWFSSRPVLISPYAVAGVGWEKHIVWSNLFRDQIERSPPVDTNKPISRQMEEQYARHYGWPYYWSGTQRELWAGGIYPLPYGPLGTNYVYPPQVQEDFSVPVGQESIEKTHLRSVKEILKYRIHANDDKCFGKVEDIIVEEESWALRYLVVQIDENYGAKKVMISPEWVDNISWEKNELFTSFDQAQIENCPEYRSEKGIDRQFESDVFDHFGRVGYWHDVVEGAGKSPGSSKDGGPAVERPHNR